MKDPIALRTALQSYLQGSEDNQKDVATALGISQGTLSNFLTGKGQTRMTTLQSVEEFLNANDFEIPTVKKIEFSDDEKAFLISTIYAGESDQKLRRKFLGNLFPEIFPSFK